MPLSGWEAMAVWNIAREIQRSGCTFASECCRTHFSFDAAQRTLYVGVRMTGCRLPSGRELYAQMHLTVLKLKDVVRPPSQEFVARVQSTCRQTFSSSSFTVAGELVPLHNDNDDPHRVLLTLSVHSKLHVQLFNVRKHLLNEIHGQADRRSNFHLSVDRP